MLSRGHFAKMVSFKRLDFITGLQVCAERLGFQNLKKNKKKPLLSLCMTVKMFYFVYQLDLANRCAIIVSPSCVTFYLKELPLVPNANSQPINRTDE